MKRVLKSRAQVVVEAVAAVVSVAVVQVPEAARVESAIAGNRLFDADEGGAAIVKWQPLCVFGTGWLPCQSCQ
jgi:hypothetical protein